MKSLAVVLPGVLLLAGAVSAAPIAGYDFDGHPGALTPSVVDSGVTATDVSFGHLGAGESSGLVTGLIFNASPNAISQAFAVINQSYFEFTITPDSGFGMNLTGLTYQVASGDPNQRSGELARSSVDNFTSNLTTAAPTPYPGFTDVTVDLSGAAYQNLTSSVTFRVYGYNTGQLTSGILLFRNLSLAGTVFGVNSTSETPEPSSLLLLLAGSFAAFTVIRRQKLLQSQLQ